MTDREEEQSLYETNNKPTKRTAYPQPKVMERVSAKGNIFKCDLSYIYNTIKKVKIKKYSIVS
jgi:hypothetical protein